MAVGVLFQVLRFAVTDDRQLINLEAITAAHGDIAAITALRFSPTAATLCIGDNQGRLSWRMRFRYKASLDDGARGALVDSWPWLA